MNSFLCLFSFFSVCVCCVVVAALCFCFCYLSWVLFVCLFSFLFLSLWLHCAACGLLASWPGVRPGPLGWEHLSPGCWNTREFLGPGNINQCDLSQGIHINTKTQLHPTACRLQCWTPYAKQPARQEHSLTHQQTGYLKLN